MPSDTASTIYGRRGGGWTGSHGKLDVAAAPRCEICGQPMVLGQKRAHGVCDPTTLETTTKGKPKP